MSPKHIALAALAAVFLLAGCATQAPTEADTVTEEPARTTAPAEVPEATVEPTPSESAAAPTEVPVVAGYQPGEIPPVPLFTLPDLSLLNDSQDEFNIKLTEIADDYPGLKVSPVSCDKAGGQVSGNGAIYLYGDGSQTYTGPDGSTLTFSDGSGISSKNGVTIVNLGNGAGIYKNKNADVTINNSGDGSGQFKSDSLKVILDGKGGGQWKTDDAVIDNAGNGSGEYTDDTQEIVNNGDGSGEYNGVDSAGNPINIINNGDGTALVNDVEVEAEKLAPVPKLGSFPPLGALTPAKSCGVTITLDAGVLFDFDKWDIRPEGQEVLEVLAKALTENDVPSATIEGHTDAIGSDDYNQSLSEKRADSVTRALEALEVPSKLTAVGYGESRPVAPNTNKDGSDNPAGRQLNRRVEVFIPAF